MRKIFVLALLCAATAAAQYQALPATSNYPALAQTINGKPNMSSGSGAPTANCTAFLDLYTDTATNNIYGCPQTNTWALWAYGTTFTNAQHSLGGCQYFPDTHWSNVDVSNPAVYPVDYGSSTWMAHFATGWPTVSNATWAAGTATLTVSSTSTLTTGGQYSITGINPSGYNANSSTPYITVVVTDGTHITYAVASNPGSYVSGGVVPNSAGNRMGVDKGMAINTATNATTVPAVTSSNTNWWENDVGPFPILTTMYVEQGGTVAAPGSCGDCHLLVLNTDTCTMYEAGNIASTSAPFNLGAIAIWNLKSNNQRLNYTSPAFTGDNTDTDGITSADVAGTPIGALVLTHAELYAGCPGGVGTCTPVKHALRITFTNSGGPGGFIWPATHATNTGSVPMGMRIILPSTYSATCQNFDQIGQSWSTYPPMASLIWTLQHYGAIAADYGENTQITADADPAWGSGGGSDSTNMALWAHCVLATDFQVIREVPTQGFNSGAIK